MEDLPAVFRRATGVDAADFFARYVDGTDTLPVADCLRDAGLEAGIKGYAAEIWAWENPDATAAQRAVREGLKGGE